MGAVPLDQARSLLLSNSFRINEPNSLASQNISSPFSQRSSTYHTANSTALIPLVKDNDNNISTISSAIGPASVSNTSQPNQPNQSNQLNEPNEPNRQDSVYVTAKSSITGVHSGISLSPDPGQSSSQDDMLIHTYDSSLQPIDPLEDYRMPDLGLLNEIQHTPPYTPSHNSFSGFGKPSLRQSIISRQSSRILPPNNRIVDYMEEQMVRWRPPGSSFHAEEILSGKHPFQQNNVPIHEIQQQQSVLENSTTDNSTTNITPTDSMANSIARSPFVTSVDPSTQTPNLQRNHKVRATFSEHNNSTDAVTKPFADPAIVVSNKLKGKKDLMDNSDGEDVDSIQESLNFRSNGQGSASASSSVIRVLNQENRKDLLLAKGEEPKGKSTAFIFSPDQQMLQQNVESAKTIDAQPLLQQDMELLTKDQPQHVTEQIIFSQSENDPIQEYLREDEDKDCWTEFTEAWSDMFVDCVDFFTCNFDPDPNHIYS